MEINAIGDKVLAWMIDAPDGEFKKATKSGILIAEKDMSEAAIRPRWFKVHAVGPKMKFVSVDDYVLVAHGRWSNGIKLTDGKKIYQLDNDELLVVSDENPLENEITFN